MAEGMNPGECRSCKAPIYWVKTVNGRPMPVDRGAGQGIVMIDGVAHVEGLPEPFQKLPECRATSKGALMLDLLPKDVRARVPKEVSTQVQMNGPTEKMMEDAFVSLLTRRGRDPRRQVKCASGKADVVDSEFCYELKRNGHVPNDFFQGVGQAVCYAASLGLRPALVLMYGPRRDDHIESVERAGVSVMFFSSLDVLLELYGGS